MNPKRSALLLFVAGTWAAMGGPTYLCAEPPPADPPGETTEDLRERLQRELGSAAVSEDENRMLEVARKMRQVERFIAGNDSGPNTRRLQKQIVSDLELMIEEFRRRSQQGRSGAGAEQKMAVRPAPGQPQQGGTGRHPSDQPPSGGTPRPEDDGPPHPANKEMVREVITKLWGELPQHEAEQMMQMLSDEYLPKYRREIEAYFRRLSEGKGW